MLIPELLAVLPGAAQDETREAEVEMPADHVNERLAGKKALVRATVRGVKEKHLPELDDDLARDLSEGKQEDVAAFRAAVRADLEETARRVEEMAFEQAVVRAVVEGSELEVPDALIDRELERRLDEIEHQLGHQGLRLEAYLAYQQLTREQWLERERPEAEARLRVDLVLDSAAKRLAVEPSDEDVAAYLSSEVQKDPELAPRAAELLLSRPARQYFRDRLVRVRTLERLKELAGGGQAPAGDAAEAAADPSAGVPEGGD